jgi:hypothetical protein
MAAMSTETGQQLALWFARFAMAGWFLFALGWLRMRRAGNQPDTTGKATTANPGLLRWSWTLATACHVIHVLLAFAWFHQWDHKAAMQHTAERTAAVTGFHWSGGIWFNHLFTLMAVGETALWWIAPGRILARSPRWNRLIYGFFAFMIFNAGVVFVRGPLRWPGLAGFVVLFFLMMRNPSDQPWRETGGRQE